MQNTNKKLKEVKKQGLQGPSTRSPPKWFKQKFSEDNWNKLCEAEDNTFRDKNLKGTELDYMKLILLVFSGNSHTFNLTVPQNYSYRNNHDLMLNLKSRTQSSMYPNTLKKELIEEFWFFYTFAWNFQISVNICIYYTINHRLKNTHTHTLTEIPLINTCQERKIPNFTE